MEYTLNVRAFIDIKLKEKANAHAARLFPGLSLQNKGRYWKDERQWEIQVNQGVEYCDDKTALWETLRYFHRVVPNWLITVGPNDDAFELLIRAIGENSDGTGLTWCSFEICRGSGRGFTEGF